MNLQELGVQEIAVQEMKKIDGGMNDRPFGTSYDGYPSGGGSGSEEDKVPGWLWALYDIVHNL
jgi:hypothetical protein